MTPQQYGPLIGIGIAVVVILLRNRQKRTLRPELMWILPALFIPLIGFGLWGMRQAPGADLTPYGPADWALLAGSLMLGLAAGFWRGSMVTIEKGQDGVLKAQASPLGIILIVALLAVRSFARPWLEGHAESLGLHVVAVEQGFLLLAGGLIVAQRIEMFIRARRIMAGAPDAHTEVTAQAL
ncbi:CcdC protein domain-containing protein [Brevundimonas sp. Root1423]|uniref:CcdC protein domain-containing protein n=1 Tax=Brevundimonas sp. Root1423 TaxID=1736462 RepID=UPI0006FC1243|nr:CcdC protein domain-containing protein [Brevundimonas sp. Root1423]KQY80508.1 hypothetical protein ASD25_10335 [Brevundimonas sp. Root1423]